MGFMFWFCFSCSILVPLLAYSHFSKVHEFAERSDLDAYICIIIGYLLGVIIGSVFGSYFITDIFTLIMGG